jgi:hypothetical protein
MLDTVFGFHPLTIEDSITPRVDPAKIDDYGSYLFIVVQALNRYQRGEELASSEVDFYLGPNYVVSIHLEEVPAIDHLHDLCQRDERQRERSSLACRESSDRLVEVLWGDDPPATAFPTLRTYVSRLRHMLPSSCARLETLAPGYRLAVGVGHGDRLARARQRPPRPQAGRGPGHATGAQRGGRRLWPQQARRAGIG